MKQHEESGRQLVCLKAEALHAFFNSWTIFFETQIINCLFLFYSDHNLCFRFFKKPNKRICERLSFWASNKIANFGHAEEARAGVTTHHQSVPCRSHVYRPRLLGIFNRCMFGVCLVVIWKDDFNIIFKINNTWIYSAFVWVKNRKPFLLIIITKQTQTFHWF